MFSLYCRKDIIKSPELDKLRQKISDVYRADESQCVSSLLDYVDLSSEKNLQAKQMATTLISKVRKRKQKSTGINVLMQEFKLSTNEGIALMCLVESLLRIPDKYTQNQLIVEKINQGNWLSHVTTEQFFLNAASWGLVIAGKVVHTNQASIISGLQQVIAKGGIPIIRKALKVAVKFVGDQLVMAENITDAIKKSGSKQLIGYTFSYDMLGEAAMTEHDAKVYLDAYTKAIHAVGKSSGGKGVHHSSGVSIKLSAIYSRYQLAKYADVMNVLYPRLKDLYLLAYRYEIGLFIDAEEADFLEISLDLLERLVSEPELKEFKGIGFVVQAYQRRAFYVLDYIAKLGEVTNNRIMVRLVKGAYWDSEIKRAQQAGYSDYPVFTRKFYTDLSYLACAQKLFTYQQDIYPLFATHNAYTLATIYEMGREHDYQFQCLYGMGESLYDNIIGDLNYGIACKVYAPVGSYETLLAYLVRRLLENGANSSFVYQIMDRSLELEKLLSDPIELSRKASGISNPYFTKPVAIYPDGRKNSFSLDLTHQATLHYIEQQINQNYANKQYHVHSLIAKHDIPNHSNNNVNDNSSNNVSDNSSYSSHHESWQSKKSINLVSPADHNDVMGKAYFASIQDVMSALSSASGAISIWQHTPAKTRAEFIIKLADLLETNYIELVAILIREAGKTYNNAIAEVREAVDFCRYYAWQVITEFDNQTHHARGILVCISPWNFPLAIFLGEVCSALVSGNVVIAKPAEQTNIIASYAINLLHSVGVPIAVMQLVLGDGAIVGDALTKDQRINGVIFTGSTEVAQLINQNLASNPNDTVLIAETGGQNAMIVDSTALPEQVVNDSIISGFDSAGQRCSALRVLYLQEEIADKVITMLKGAMDTLRVGDPRKLSTDVGPVIDQEAHTNLSKHIDTFKQSAIAYYQAPLANECKSGNFIAPTLFEITSIKELKREVFGPIIHVIRFKGNQLDNVIKEINCSGYGLTQGIHSRINGTAVKVYSQVHAGNIYVNRNTVGAVVGVQPFGGEGLSGTGPKAGGMHYLYRLLKSYPHTGYPNINNFKNVDLSYLDDIVTQLVAQRDRRLHGLLQDLKSLNIADDAWVELEAFASNVVNSSLMDKSFTMPSYTGECNFMFFNGRGTVLCLANSENLLLKQLIYTFANGNDAILPDSILAQKLISKFPQWISILVAINQIDKLHLVLASSDYPNLAQIKVEVAKLGGAIVPVLIADVSNVSNVSNGASAISSETDELFYPAYMLVNERSISINVTATVGNTQLMSIVDEV